MAYQAETPSPAITSAPALAGRKRLILLCCEDLRPVACSLEDALRSRGWDVTVEFGADARPWVQRIPPVRPSLRVLCVPGTVDREFAQKIRTALDPDPDADLQILGVDDSCGLVHEIERLAGVKTPPRRPLYAPPRLAHPTVIETQLRHERSWLVGATATLGVFALTLGGIAAAKVSTHATALPALPAAALAPAITAPVVEELPPTPGPMPERGDPVLSAVATPSFDDWALDPLPEEPEVAPEEQEDDGDLIIFDDDEPAPRTRVVEVVAPPLDDPRPRTRAPITPPTVDDAMTLAEPELPVVPTTREIKLPPGFLPVAGMTVASGPTTHDPFAATPITPTTAPALVTVDPFSDVLGPTSP